MSKQESRDTLQSLLQQAWAEAPEGRLPAWEQAKAWALREMWRKEQESEWGMLSYICSKVKKAVAETVPKRPWLETHEQYGQRLKACCKAINRNLDVEGLCRQWMVRIQELKDKQGDLLRH